MRGVYFDWKDDSGGYADFGFIAEEVEKIIPEAIHYEKDGTTPLAVKYSNLVAVAVEAVKIQQGQIEKQQKQIEELEGQYAALHDEFTALKEEIQGTIMLTT